MTTRFSLRVMTGYFLIAAAVLFGAEPQLLKTEDVSKVMQQMFSQHVDKKEVTGNVIRSSFRIYIDQFDPYRVYLLQSEVQPYVAPSDRDIDRYVEEYKTNDFSAYTKLNEVIQKSIARARTIRAEQEKDPAAIYRKSQLDIKEQGGQLLDPDLKRPFAQNVEELKVRSGNNLAKYFVSEIRRYGDTALAQNQVSALEMYEKHLRELENQYLYLDENGHPVSAAEKENLFVMHVLKSLAGSLDAHTSFFNPTEAYDMKVRLEKEFEGIGVVLSQGSDGSIVIGKLVVGGPAAKSGQVKPEDKIVQIDGKKVTEESFDQAMDMIRGKKGTPVTLVLKRDVEENGVPASKELTVTLKREAIAVNDDRVDTRFEKVDGGIVGIITLHSFYQGENGVTSENDVRAAIQKLRSQGNLKGLIVDMRDNSGGFLSQAVKVAGLFITDGIVVISKYFNGDQHIYRDIDATDLYDGPLVILTSRATASAAEIVAQALQDYGVAVIVGDERTYGKGTIQSQTVTGDGSTSYFKVTVGKYYTVSGKTPQIQGVKADIVAPSILSNEHIGEEYLDYALPADKIPAEYQDPLADIDPNLKQWYLHYYVPHEQQKLDTWRKMIPALQKNSQFRIGHNEDYQQFLQRLKEPKKGGTLRQTNSMGGDLQMAEAISVVKDMIFLQQHARGGGIVDLSTPATEKKQEVSK